MTKKLEVMTEQERKKERAYQHDYYLRKRKDRREAAKHRWRTDPDYRKRETERARKSRADARAQKAKRRFKRKIEEKKSVERKPRAPRLVLIDGKKQWVYTTGSFGKFIGREPNTIRAWMSQGVLPGCSIFIGRSRRFSKGFCEAVRAACERLFFLSGRGERTVLRRLVMEELEKAGESYIPSGGTEKDRVRLGKRGGDKKEAAA